MNLKTCLAAALVVAAPVSALAAPGLVRNSATLRAGPGFGFPAVDRIPAGARVNIHGCIRGGAWCDVSYAGERGWVAATRLAYLYRHRYVYLPDYADDVPIVPFVLSSYWDSYYVGRPWYHRHAYWDRYWHQHPPAVAYGSRPHARFAGRPDVGVAPGPGVVGRGWHRQGPGGFAQHERGPSAPIAIGHQAGPHRFGGMQPGAGAHVGARFAPGPVARPNLTPHNVAPHMAQPNFARPSGPPMAAHAQMGGAPRGPVGGAPHLGGAPHVGGAPMGAAPHMGGGGGGGPRGGGPGHPH